MNNFNVIYKVLSYLECSMDGVVDSERLTGKFYGISEERFRALLAMLFENGYIKTRYETATDRSKIIITLSGLEYWESNPMMIEAREGAKGIAELIP